MSKSLLKKLKTDSISNSDNANTNYELITDVFSNIAEKDAPLKKVFEGRPGTVPY